MVLSAIMLVKGNSRRLPNKNIRKFKGKPMFLWNLEKCLKIFEEVYVSSDNPNILQLAKKAGAKIIERPKYLCGEVPNIPCYQHALAFMNFPDGIIAVQANSPTLDRRLIILVMRLLEFGHQEVMTCHKNHELYGSVWGMTIKRLIDYPDPYKPNPDTYLIDPSVDIHTQKDFNKALCQMKKS